MDDEIARAGIVHGCLRLGFPRVIGGAVIGENADDIDSGQIGEFHIVDAFKLPSEDEVEQLFRGIALFHFGSS